MIRKSLVSFLLVILVFTGCSKSPAGQDTATPTPTGSKEVKTTPTETMAPETEPIEANAIPIGDWIINGNETVENQKYLMTGNLVVTTGSSLTLRNVILIVNCTHDGQYGITVEKDASLLVYSSKITTLNPLRRWAPGYTTAYQRNGVTEQESPRFSFLADNAAEFVMKDSSLQGCGWGEPYGDHYLKSTGLWLVGVRNATIEGNTFTKNHTGFSIDNMTDVTIRDNIFTGNDGHGLHLGHVSNVMVTENTFSANLFGVYFASPAADNTVNNNKFTDHPESGVVLSMGCDSNVITNNAISATLQMAWSGIVIGVMGQPANNNIITGNTISGFQDGINMYYSFNNRLENNTVTDCDSGIILGYASKNIIAGNTIARVGSNAVSGHENGIHLFHSQDNTIANNRISQVNIYGIMLHNSSSNNVIKGNEIESCQRGIGVYYSSDKNTIADNTVSLNEESPIILNSSNNNVIYGNNFYDKGDEAYDDAANTWDQETKGNYWGDGAGNIFFVNPKGADSYPLTEPAILTKFTIPEQENIPSNQAYFTGRPIVGEAAGLYEPVMGQVTRQDTTITLDSPQLIIENGGSLTLENVTLIIPKGCWGIIVRAGGSLYINNSKILPAEDGGGFIFQIQKDATLSMNNSELRSCGFTPHSGEWGGLVIYSQKVTMENNLIAESYYGIYIDLRNAEGTSFSVKNNTIMNCYLGLKNVYSIGVNNVADNTIINCLK